MKTVYIIRFNPSGLYVSYRNTKKNIIKLSAFDSCNVFSKRPDIAAWFGSYNPITVHGYDRVLPSDFSVEAISIKQDKKEYVKVLLFYTYSYLLFLYKVPVVIIIALAHVGKKIFKDIKDLCTSKKRIQLNEEDFMFLANRQELVVLREMDRLYNDRNINGVPRERDL